MHSVRNRCPTLVASTSRAGVWRRSYATKAASEDADEFIRAPSEKYDLVKNYSRPATKMVTHPKLKVDIRPFQAKHTQDREPWLFMLGAFPKTVHELNKEEEEKKLSPPGSEFHGVWLKNEDVERAQQERFAKELITFRNNYERPITDAFKEVDSQIEAEYTQQRFEKRKLTREARKKAHKKAQPGSTLLKYMHEKEYWEKFIDAMQVGDFATMPPRKEFMEMMEFESLKYDIAEPDYDTEVIKIDYGQKSDWSISQHMALMIPDDEVQDLSINTLFPPETQDQLYRAVRELEHVYGPVNHKLEAFHKNQSLAVEVHRENYLLSKGKEIPPGVDEIFNPSHITEFDDIEDPDSVSLEEIGYRLDKAYENWKKRLLDPEVENRVKNYVKNITGGGVWNRLTMGGNNKIMQFADSSIADMRIFLEDEDVVRILKGQLVDAGLARVVVKRKSERELAKERAIQERKAAYAAKIAKGELPALSELQSMKEAGKEGKEGKESTRGVGTTGEAGEGEGAKGTEGAVGGAGLQPLKQTKYFTETDKTIEYTLNGKTFVSKKSPILTDDLHTYMEFEPVYKDKGTFILPMKKKREKIITKESEEDKFSQDVWGLDDRSQGPSRLSTKHRGKYLPLYKDHLEYQRMDAAELQDSIEEVEDELEAYREYQKIAAIWPQPQVGGQDLVGDALEKFMKSRRWYPVDHLKYNNNVEFFTRTLPLAPELKRADIARMRKVVMRVYIPPLELPYPVDQRLKLLLGPRYDQLAGVVKLTGSDRHTQKDNKAYLKLLFREILHEAWLADPNYIPTRAPAIEAPLSWKPSEASANVTKPVLFRLYGAPLQNSFQQQAALDRLSTTLNNPEGIIPNPKSSRLSSFLAPIVPPPHKVQDPEVVAANRQKQVEANAIKKAREPNYKYEPTEYYSASNKKVGDTSATAKQRRIEEERKGEPVIQRDENGKRILSRQEEQDEKARERQKSKEAKREHNVREKVKESQQLHRDMMIKRREEVKQALAQGLPPPPPPRPASRAPPPPPPSSMKKPPPAFNKPPPAFNKK